MASLRPPKQSRSRQTLERLVEASLDILSEQGPNGLTVHAVVDRAGSSVGSFYARFGGKDDLLDYLGDRVWEEAQQRWDLQLRSRDWAEVPLSESAEAAVGLLIDAQRSRSRYLRALDRVAGRQGDAYETFRAHILEGLSHVLLARDSEVRHERPALAVRLALEAVRGVIDAEIADGGSELDREELLAECRALVLAYLTGSGGHEGGASVDFFDVWG